MDKKLSGLIILFFLSFGLFISVMIFNKPLSRLTRAKEEFIPSSQTSVIFAWPLTAKVNDKIPVNINVFIRNSNNIPLANKKVSLNTTLGEIKEIQPISDKGGKTSFILQSTTAGIAEITAVVDNQIYLTHKVTVKFE